MSQYARFVCLARGRFLEVEGTDAFSTVVGNNASLFELEELLVNSLNSVKLPRSQSLAMTKITAVAALRFVSGSLLPHCTQYTISRGSF